MSKLDQLKALGAARIARAKPNSFEDAARGRDPKPKTNPELDGAFAVLLPETKRALPMPRARPSEEKTIGCPICDARRKKKAAAQKRWRQKEKK